MLLIYLYSMSAKCERKRLNGGYAFIGSDVRDCVKNLINSRDLNQNVESIVPGQSLL